MVLPMTNKQQFLLKDRRDQTVTSTRIQVMTFKLRIMLRVEAMKVRLELNTPRCQDLVQEQRNQHKKVNTKETKIPLKSRPSTSLTQNIKSEPTKQDSQ